MKQTLLTTLILTALSTFSPVSVAADTLKQDIKITPPTNMQSQDEKLKQASPVINVPNKGGSQVGIQPIKKPNTANINTLPTQINSPQFIKAGPMNKATKSPTYTNQSHPSSQAPASAHSRPQAGFINKMPSQTTGTSSPTTNNTPRINSIGGPTTQDSTVFIHPSKEGGKSTATNNGVSRTANPSSTASSLTEIKPKTQSSAAGGFYGKVETSTSTTGEATFTLPNGQQTPQRGPNGRMGVPDDKGGVLYADGTYVNGGRKGENTLVFNPDGTQRSSTPTPGSNGDMPSNQGGAVSSSVADIKPKTQSSAAGGFYGKVETSTSTTGEATFTLPNGQQTPQRGPDGSMGMPDDKGGVLYADGTYVNGGRKGENTLVFNPDGTQRSSTPPPGSSNNNDDNSSSSNSSNDNSDDNDNDDSSDDSSSDDSDNSDDSSDSDDTSEDTTDSGEGDTGGAEDDTDDTAAEGQTGHEMGSDPTRSYRSAGKDYVDSKTRPGSREPEDIGPPDCGDGEGGQVMEPQPGQENCGPGIQSGSDDDEEDQSSDPLWRAPAGTTGPDSVIQPGIEGDRMDEEGVAPLERLQGDLDSITNPGRP